MLSKVKISVEIEGENTKCTSIKLIICTDYILS